MVGTAHLERSPEGGHSVYWELPDQFNAALEELLAEAYAEPNHRSRPSRE